MLLAACANPLASTPPTPTPEEPTRTPTATPIELDATVRLEEGGFSLDYPEGWEARISASTVSMAATEAALDAANPGENLVVLVDAVPLSTLSEQHGPSAVEDVDGLFDVSSTEFRQAGYALGDPRSITVDDEEGLSAALVASGGAGQLVVVQLADSRVRVVGQASPAAWDEQQEIFDEIVDSIEFFDPVLPATPTPENMATQPITVTEGPENFVLRLGGNQGPLGGRFVSARGLTTAKDGTLYVAESSRGIWVFEPDGTLKTTFGETELLDAFDVALGTNGDLYVVDYGRNDIARFKPAGTLVERWGEVGEGEGQFGSQSPKRIAVGPDGSIYALDTRISADSVNSSLVRFDATGAFIERIPLPAGSDPNDLAVDSSGNIYLAETFRGAVTKVDGQGQLLARLGEDIDQGIAASAVDVDALDNVYVVTLGRGVLKFSPGGTLITNAGAVAERGSIPQPGEFSQPNGIAAGPGGIVWVSDNDGEYSAITALRLVGEAVAANSDEATTEEGEPGEPAAEPEPTPVPEELLISQWASEASASSSYDDSYAPDGATGPPDVQICMSSPDAWASSAPDTKETLSLGFDEPVFATRLNIYQNHQPGFISRIDVTDEQGDTTRVYSGTAELVDVCPFVLTTNFGPTLSRVVSVTLTIDQTQGATWSEIDAVELVGLR
jgi:sugar lactone lactonase YvrE